MELRKDTALLLCCVVLVATVDAISRPSTMVLENNQFKNVVIAIHDSVAEDKSLIDTLKVGNLQSFFRSLRSLNAEYSLFKLVIGA